MKDRCLKQLGAEHERPVARGFRHAAARAPSVWACCVLAVTALSIARAEEAATQPLEDTLFAPSQISVLTILPGDQVYSLFGHSAFRVFDPDSGLDRVYNYGTFEFGNPIVFAARFAYGKLDYYLSTTPFSRTLRYYREVEHRPIIEQVLNLTTEERARLFSFLEWNALPENRVYRYDFLFDNCSTRIRDALFDYTPGLRLGSLGEGPPSFRRMLDPYGAERPMLGLGWDLLMGVPVDRRPEAWERMFLPVDLMTALEEAIVVRGSDTEPIAAARDTLFWIQGRGMPDPGLPWPSMLGWLVFAAGLLITVRERTRGPLYGRWFDVTLFWIVGLVGTLVAFMWLLTLHSVTLYNWNVLWAWPPHLVAAIGLARPRRWRWLRGYLTAYAVVSAVFLLGWTLWPQGLHVAVIPLVLVLLLRSAWLASVGQRAWDGAVRVPAEAS